MTLSAARLFAADANPVPDFFLIQNFDGQELTNRLGGSTGKWELDATDKSQWCNISFSPDNAGFMEQGYSLKIDYKIDSAKENFVTPEQGMSRQEVGRHGITANGIFMTLNGFDATPYRYLSFRIKGDSTAGFTRRFKVELKDKERAASADVEGVAEGWQTLYIPVSKFQNQVRMNALSEFVITFDPYVTRPQGTLYLDQIGFAKEMAKPATPGGVDSLKIPQLRLRKVKKPVKIDGDLSDWKGQCFDLGKENVEMGQFLEKSNGSAKVCLARDAQYLYIGADVKDNEILCRASGADIYKMDGVEIFINPKNNGLEWKNAADFQLGLAPTGPDGKPQAWLHFQKREPSEREVKAASEISGGGYRIEAAVSLDFLGLNGVDGETFGFSAALHDVDSKDAHESKMNWHFKKDDATGRLQLGEVRFED